MAREIVEVAIHTCDNQNCLKQVTTDKDEAAMGFHGYVWMNAETHGSDQVRFYACSERCIRGAVLSVLER